MIDQAKGTLADREASSEEIRRGMDRAIAATLREHKEAGRSVVQWDREKDEIRIVPADEIVIPDGSQEVATAGDRGRGRGSVQANDRGALPPHQTH